MRPPASLILLAGAIVACSPAETVVARERTEEAGGVAGQTYVLRRVDGALLPARVQESAEGYAELLADTLRFTADTAHASGAARIVAGPPAVPHDSGHVARPPAVSHDSVYTQRLARDYTVRDGQVRIGDVPCGEPRELILCAPPDTGRVHGDTLVLATAMPGTARRAYVRIDEP